MNFSEEQQNQIFQFILNYNEDSEFKMDRESKYNEEPNKLSIIEIYVLEEILRYGHRGIYKKFLEAKGTKDEETAVVLFDEFVNNLSVNTSFMQQKSEEALKSLEVLAQLEMLELAYTLVKIAQEKAKIRERSAGLEYDALNPILYSNNQELRETLKNLVLGEFILRLMELPAMETIKKRMLDGKIANEDKAIVIENIRKVTTMKDFPAQLSEQIDNIYPAVKEDLLEGKGEEAFGEYLQYNTNISASEIFGLKEAKQEQESPNGLKL